MSARDELAQATARLENLAVRIREAANTPRAGVEELAQQASDLSSAVAEMIPRAIAEAEAEARAGSPPRAPDAPDTLETPASE